MKNFQEINRYPSMYLTALYEPRDNGLCLEISESMTSETVQDVLINDKVISENRLLSVNENGTKFNISFHRYVAYQVFNESFLNFNDWDEYETGEFNTFCIFKKSRYMGFIKNETIADYIFPDELKHYGVYCQNHVVHIISTLEPVIEKISNIPQL
ncbi:hypothetical protein [Nibribacter koreensis]